MQAGQPAPNACAWQQRSLGKSLTLLMNVLQQRDVPPVVEDAGAARALHAEEGFTLICMHAEEGPGAGVPSCTSRPCW